MWGARQALRVGAARVAWGGIGGIAPAVADRQLRGLAAAAAGGLKISGAAVLERYPVVVPKAPQFEIEYKEWREKWNEHKYQILPDEWGAPERATEDDGEMGEGKWQPAPLVTEDDKKNNRKSLYRKLDTKLYLLVKDKSGAWTFPNAAHAEGETIRGTAERALGGAVGEDVDRYFIGNAPAGHRGGEMFFHRAQILNSVFDNIRLEGGGYSDHVWAAKDEFSEYFDEDMTALLAKML